MSFGERQRIGVRTTAAGGGEEVATLPAPRAPRPEEHTGVDPGDRGTPFGLRRLPAEGRVSIVGAAHFRRELHAAAAAGPVQVALVPGIVDAYDGQGVRVDVVVGASTETVGYLAHVHARRYRSALHRLRDQGVLGTCPATLADDGTGLVVHLAEPDVVTRAVSAGADRTTPASAGRRRWRLRG